MNKKLHLHRNLHPGFLLLGIGIIWLAVGCAAEQVEPPPPPTQAPPPATSAATSASQPDAAPAIADRSQFDGSTFVEDEEDYLISPIIPLDGIAPIYDPQFVTADRANYLDDELVIGVEIDGEAKAYPITLLRSREMVNDELGGTPILVTW